MIFLLRLSTVHFLNTNSIRASRDVVTKDPEADSLRYQMQSANNHDKCHGLAKV